ncbi:MAG: hypothetical protein IT337_02325 [Thermomicrobiales bacterium]|nr:hypothetical protein [Thermomicrobiales bacterium]
MTEPLFTHIRTAAAEVARRARFVHLDEERIASYAASLAQRELPDPTYDIEHHFRGDPEATVAFLLTLDSINFGSGWFPHLRKRPGMSGYFTIATSLTDRFRSHGPWTATELTELTPGDLAALFGQTPGEEPIATLMAAFARALNDLGRFLLAGWDGCFTGPVADAGGSAERLAEIVSAMPLFRDVAVYDDFTVPLMKRAQLLAADLALAFAGEGYGAFHDRDRLTIFADNLAPHVLRLDEVLRFEPDLLARIEREELIPAGSPEEIEIRSVAVHAAERIVAELRRCGEATVPADLDYLLWNRGQSPAYKAHPRHRTRSVFY